MTPRYRAPPDNIIIISGNVTRAQPAWRNQPDLSNYLIQSVKFQLEYLIQKGYFHQVVRYDRVEEWGMFCIHKHGPEIE